MNRRVAKKRPTDPESCWTAKLKGDITPRGAVCYQAEPRVLFHHQHSGISLRAEPSQPGLTFAVQIRRPESISVAEQWQRAFG